MVLKHQIGKLDRYVEIVEFTETTNALNATTRVQNSIKNVWAQLKFRNSTEDFDDKVYSINQRDYIIHFDAAIATKLMQNLAVIDGGKTYYVTGVNPDIGGRNMYILLNCEYKG